MPPTSAPGAPPHNLPIWAGAGAGVLFMPLALYAPRGLAPLFILVACAMGYAWLARRATAPTVGLGSASALAFVIVAAASIAWAPDPGETTRTLVSFSATLAGAGVILYMVSRLASDEARLVSRAIAIGGAIGFTFLAMELATEGTLFRGIASLVGKQLAPERVPLALKPGLAAAAMFIWPWGLALIGCIGPSRATPLLIAAIAVLAVFGSDTANAALVVGAVFASAAATVRRWFDALCAALLAALVLAHPFIALNLPDPTQPGSRLEVLTNSADHRIYIWRNTAEEIFEAPLLGHGFDAARALYGPETVRRVEMLPDVPDRRYEVRTERIPLHPHNLTLQIWLELGGLGAVLWILFVIGLVRAIARSFPHGIGRSAAFGALGTALAIAHIGFGAWQSWWLGTLILVAALLKLAEVQLATSVDTSRQSR